MTTRSQAEIDLALAQRADMIADLAAQRAEFGTAGRKRAQAAWLRDRAAR